MFHYQIYQALTDQRQREVAAAAERHRRVVEARYGFADTTASSSRWKDLTARMVAWLRVPREAQPHSTAASTSNAGPIGCSA